MNASIRPMCFSASFVHTYRGGALRTQTRETGTVEVKKPGMMRFVYTAPERKEFISDGRKIYSYVPEDRQVEGSVLPLGVRENTVKTRLHRAKSQLRGSLAEAALDERWR